MTKMGTRNNNNAFEKGSLSGRERNHQLGVGLGLRMQQQVEESCPNYKTAFIMPMSHHSSHHNQFPSSLPSPSSSSSSCCCGSDIGFDGGVYGGGGGGPIVCNTSHQVPCRGDIYDVVGASSVSVSSAAAAAVVLKSLHQPHPFGNADPSFNPHSSSGEMAAAPLNARVAFTAAQWQELERQTMIYKYMMASIPVPPELLLPLSRNPSNVMKGALEMGFSSNSSDPEPWRCRRTDGKKWRCSRDVAPDQKYCERHSHKSRPRSRKPVELPNPNHSSINNNNNDPKSHSLLNFTSDTNKQSPHHFINQTFTSSFDQPRCLEWFMKGESTAAVPFSGNSNPEWQQFKTLDGGKYDGNVSEHQQHFKDRRLNLQAPHQHLNEQLVSPNLGSLGGAGAGLNLNQAHSQETRSFIDAWSDREVDGMGMGSKRRHHSSNQKLPLSSLTLSMSGGTNNGNYNQEDDDENGQVGAFGFMGLSTENVRGLRTPHSQMANPGSWIGSPPGGPLAEALCLGIASSQSTSTSSCSKST